MGQGRTFKRGAVWWIQYSVAGRQYRETAKTTRKADAEALLRRRQQEIWEGRFFPGRRVRSDLTVAGLKDLWESERATKRSLRQDKVRLARAVERFGAHRLVGTLTADDLAAWRDELRAKYSEATVNRHLAAMRSALNLASDRGHVHQDPFRGIRLSPERGARNRVCSPDEYRALLEGAYLELRLLIAIGYWTGMRLGEIVGAQRIDKKARSIRLTAAETKEADTKSVPLPTDAITVIDEMPKRLDGRWFTYTANTYSRHFADLCAKLKIDGLRFHDLRHTAVTSMRRAGVDLLTIQRITGHKAIQTLKRYSHVTEDDLSAAMAKTEAHAAGRDRR